MYIKILRLFTEKKLKKAFFSYGSAIPKRTPRYYNNYIIYKFMKICQEKTKLSNIYIKNERKVNE